MVVNVVSKVFSSYLLKQVLVAVSSNIFCLMTGCTFGFSAILLPQIKKDPTFVYNTSYDSWIASSSCLAMAIGCIGAGIVSDKYGRRKAFIIFATFFMIGWIILAFAYSYAILLLGRILTGMCTGAFRSLGVVYLGEITSPSNRPLFVFSLSLSGTAGILFIHLLGGYLNWRLTSLIICIPILLGIGLQVFVKESPLWLLCHNRIDKGTESFIWFRGQGEISRNELADILAKQKDRPPALTFSESLRCIFSKSFMKPLLTVFVLFATVQFCGVNTMSFYAQDLLKETFDKEQDPFILMLVTDSVRVIGVTLLFAFSKYIPRRKSYLIICIVLVILLLGLISYVAIRPTGLAWLAITIFMIYTAVGSSTVALSWSFNGELFPGSLRGLGSGIGGALTFLLLFASVQVTPIITLSYGIIATYSTYASVCFIGFIYLYFFLPQTDGKTLQEIENIYNKK